jgi:amino acid transporter
MVFKLSGIVFLFSYLLVFPAFVILRRRQPDRPRPYRMPGGNGAGTVAAVVCWAFIAFACALFFKPAPDVEAAQALRDSWILGAETVATIVVGLLLLPRARS